MTLDPTFAALNRMTIPAGRKIVIDVGAHCGFFAECWLTWQPDSSLICFEPQPEVSKQLVARFTVDPRVQCHGVAVGREAGHAALRLHEYTETTSFLAMTPQLSEAAPALAIHEIAKTDVPIVALDGFAAIPAGRITLLKIDVQGFEAEVLAGATELLKRVEYVFIEVAFEQLYVDAPSFVEIYQWMRSHGFYLVTISPHHHLAGDRLLEGDLLFRNSELSS